MIDPEVELTPYDWDEIDKRITDRQFIHTEFNGVDFRDYTFKNLVFKECSFRGTSFVRVAFYNCRFVDCDLSGAYFLDCHFEGCAFSCSEMLGCFFDDSGVDYSGLGDSSFYDTDLSGAILDSCDLTNIDWNKNTSFMGASMRRTSVSRDLYNYLKDFQGDDVIEVSIKVKLSRNEQLMINNSDCQVTGFTYREVEFNILPDGTASCYQWMQQNYDWMYAIELPPSDVRYQLVQAKVMVDEFWKKYNDKSEDAWDKFFRLGEEISKSWQSEKSVVEVLSDMRSGKD